MPEITCNGIRVHYEQRGSGEPLVLIMGLGAPGSLWEDHIAAYEKHFCCVRIDNRGAGESDKPQGPYSTRMMAEDTAELMGALGAGVIDFPRVVTMLRDTGYAGWIMVEEESVAAESEPDAATIQNGEYLRQALWPLVR